MSKKSLLITTVVLIAAVLAYAGYNRHIQNDKTPIGTTGVDINSTAGMEEDKKASADQFGSNSQAQMASKKKVTPIITAYGYTAAGGVEVGSRVPGIIENGGTCTLVVEKDGKQITQTKKSTDNVSETSCGFISITADKFSSGTWTAQVNYSSKKARGSSESVNIEIN